MKTFITFYLSLLCVLGNAYSQNSNSLIVEVHGRDTIFMEHLDDKNNNLTHFDKYPQARFHGDMKAFIKHNLRYPPDAKKAGIEGTAEVFFWVTAQGKIVEPGVVNTVDPLLKKEALRIVSIMPDWEPPVVNGKAIISFGMIKVVFKL